MTVALGVLGGMGCLASAEFTRTVYELNVHVREQDSPAVILLSDPAFPDRTQTFIDGDIAGLVSLLRRRLAQLYALGAGRVVMGCVTLHYALPLLPGELRGRVLSLVDVALTEAAESGRRQLLLCSSGSRAARVFEGHELWPRLAGRIVLPDEEDQQFVHSMLYRYKVEVGEQPLLPYLEGLLDKYDADSFIAGCSELHLLTKHLRLRPTPYRFIDPLLLIAQNLDAYLAPDAAPKVGLPEACSV
jgi:aspartate racemase